MAPTSESHKASAFTATLKSSCIKAEADLTISSDFDPNPNPFYVLFRRFLDCLIVAVDILFQDEIVKEINEPNSRWKAVFCGRFANTTVLDGTN
ncbi:unnamed protein product [Brassica rapa]|uniref:Uncharacterized protein n=1 Tax=Brassica campestris TaxID=3711 RepID=A0A8D9HVL5_BRACM|nr:unnamed protein product [Brassica rapa]